MDLIGSGSRGAEPGKREGKTGWEKNKHGLTEAMICYSC